MKILPAVLIIVLIHSSFTHAQDVRPIQLESFEEVWLTIDETHFDPSMNGVDWPAMYERYKPEIKSVQDSEGFIKVANRMLFELGLSHALVASEKMLKSYMPVLFSPGTVGADVRWLKKKAIVTKVRAGLPAHIAGLRPGYELIMIGGETVDSIVTGAEPLPPFNDRNRVGGISNYLVGRLDGQPGTSIALLYLDHESRQKEILLTRQSRGEGEIINAAMPPVFVEFEAKRLEGDIAYVWFNHFAQPVGQNFLDALDKMGRTKGLIIDLRGNPGGYFKILDIIAGKLIGRETNLYHFRLREKTVQRVFQPAEIPYEQPVAIIIDETSMSSSELFASCLQAIKRAVLFGKQSPGYLLGAQWQRLPNDLSFMYPILQPIPAGGYIVENNGVVPDRTVELSVNRLLLGEDAQLEAAIDYILQENGVRPRCPLSR